MCLKEDIISECAVAMGASSMPKKSTTKRKEAQKETEDAQRTSEAEVHPSTSHIAEELRKQQLRVLDEVSASITAQQKACGEILDKWLGFSADTYRNMTKVATEGGKKYSSIYDLWSEYYEKLNAKILEASRKNLNEYTDAVEHWRDLTGMLEDLFVPPAEIKPERIEEIQRKSAEFSDYLAKRAGEVGEGAVSDFLDIQSTWLEFAEKIGRLVGDVITEDEMYKALMGTWDSAVSQMTSDISNFVDTSTREYKRYQEMWDDIFSTTVNTMMRSAKPFFRGKERA
ncbi:MAG: hypothetical protein AB1665_06520 [Candidatus Thermoplasmatota archaeon]